MTIGVSNFIGPRLTEARLFKGLLKSELAAAVGVSGTAIGRYEDGTDKPSQERLVALAGYLKLPLTFFSKPVWPEKPSRIHWRTQASETKRARDMTEQRMTWLAELFGLLEVELEFPEFRLPKLDLPDFRDLTGNQIESAALAVREQWGLGEFPISDVVLALENNGVPVAMLNIPSEKQDGFTFTSEVLHRSFVGINRSEVSRTRGRFDAAHELGHLVLHRSVDDSYVASKIHDDLMEQQAHRFAGAFLFPERQFISQLESITLDYMAAMKARWGISIAAMVMRAHDLELIGKDHRAELFRLMTRRGWRGRRREPLDDLETSPIERPRMIRRGIEEFVSGTSFGKAALVSTVALPESEIEALAGLPSGYFGELQQPRVQRRDSVSAVDLETGTVIQFPSRTTSSK